MEVRSKVYTYRTTVKWTEQKKLCKLILENSKEPMSNSQRLFKT